MFDFLPMSAFGPMVVAAVAMGLATYSRWLTRNRSPDVERVLALWQAAGPDGLRDDPAPYGVDVRGRVLRHPGVPDVEATATFYLEPFGGDVSYALHVGDTSRDLTSRADKAAIHALFLYADGNAARRRDKAISAGLTRAELRARNRRV